MAGSTAESPDLLLSSQVPTQITKSSTGDFFVDAKTDLSWSTRVSVELDYLEAPSYCASLGAGWRLPTLGELATMNAGTGKKRAMRNEFRTGLPSDGFLFSSEEIPVIDDEKQPLVMRIQNGSTVNGYGREGYARCAHGEVTRARKPYQEPAAALLGERWWLGAKACPSGAIARGTPGRTISCIGKAGKRQGRSTSWSKSGRKDESYRSGELNGPVTHFRADGARSSVVQYRNGDVHGLTTHWHGNGIKASESNFVSGVLNGTQKRWDTDGHLQVRTRYRKGRILEQLYYDFDKPRDGLTKQKHANGVDSYKGIFKKGRAIGQHYGYHANGKLRFKRVYNSKGVPHGTSADWHPNGQPHEVSTFKNGALQGEWVVFSSGGKPLKRVYYDNGSVVRR